VYRLVKELDKKGIDIEIGSWKSLVEEAPSVYKDIDEVAKSFRYGWFRKINCPIKTSCCNERIEDFINSIFLYYI